jgi:hypothetical protein
VKARFLTATVGAALVIGLIAASSQAQTASFQAKIPFEFVAGHYTLPAGQYIFQRLLLKAKTQDAIGVLVVKSIDSSIYRAIVTALGPKTGDAGSGNSKLVFARREGRHYLERVWLAGDKVAHVLPNVPRETGVARKAEAGDVISLAQLR